MKIDLDIPMKAGDSVFFCEGLPEIQEAKITSIRVDFIQNIAQPVITIYWAQYGLDAGIAQIWDDGEFDLNDLNNTFWLTHEDAVKANQDIFDDYLFELRELEQEEKY